MGLSKRYLATNDQPVPFSAEALAVALKAGCPEVSFAYLMGSSAHSQVVPPHSDLDVAIYCTQSPTFATRSLVEGVCEQAVPGVRIDLGVLNNAEPVYRFEALKGHLLFYRDQECWLTFYSRTCREYEHQMVHYEKQRLYRLEAHAS